MGESYTSYWANPSTDNPLCALELFRYTVIAHPLLRVVALCEKLMGVVRERVSLTKSAPAKLPDTTATEQVATPSAPPPSYPPPAIPVPTVSPRESAQPALVGPLTPTTSTSTTTSATTSTPNSNESTNTKPKKDAKHHLWYLPSPLQDTSNLLSAEDVTNVRRAI